MDPSLRQNGEEERRSWSKATTIAAVITVVLIVVGVAGAAIQIWPYNDASIEIGDLVSEEFTSDGVPVFHVGRDVTVMVEELCNKGVDVVTERWVDRYGANATRNDLPLDVRSTSSLFSTTEFFTPPPELRSGAECFGPFPARIPIDFSIDTPGYYRIRSVNWYQPNPFTTVTYSNETDLFYLVDEGDPIP